MWNKREKEVAQAMLDKEQAVLKALEKHYRMALEDVNLSIRILQSDEQTQSKIHRIRYQETLKKQLEGILEKLHTDSYRSIQHYLNDSYTDAFVGVMYDLHGQDVPVIAPIDQNAAIKAIQLDTKLSERKIHPNANGEHVTLYESLGVDVDNLKKTIRSEITRGISTGMKYEDIARNVSMVAKAPLARAKTIVRTEGHRIQQASQEDARQAAKARGADVVKQWDSTLDGETRSTHRYLDGQIREVNKPFTSGTKEAMFPGDFGDPALDCNCRCTALTRARKALDEEELAIMKERAKFFGLEEDKKQSFAEFKKTYLKTTETLKKQGKSGIIQVPEDPFYKGLSKEEIAARYVKKDGSNLLEVSFLNMPLDILREAVQGYDTVIGLYGNVPPQRIKAGQLGSKIFAQYSTGFKTITMNTAMSYAKGEAYATLIHEMTHHAETVMLFNGNAVVKDALKKLGLRSNSKQADVLKMRTVGSLKKDEWNDPSEIVAYAVERQMTGRTNDLTEAIFAILKEKGAIK